LLERVERIRINHFSQVKAYDEIFVIGDIASMETDEYPEGHPIMGPPAL
jgi:NADH dehydrogenase